MNGASPDDTASLRQPLGRASRLLRAGVDFDHPRRLPAALRHAPVRRAMPTRPEHPDRCVQQNARVGGKAKFDILFIME